MMTGDRMKTRPCAGRVVTTREIAAVVSRLAPKFLEGFAPCDLAEILGAATLRRFQGRSLIASEGCSSDKVFLLLEGLARTFTMTCRGEKMILLWIQPSEVSGGRALLTKPSVYLVSTETVMDSVVLAWNRRAILLLTKQYPRLLENALLIASDYVETYRDLHLAASFHTASERVAGVLNHLTIGMGQKSSEGTILNIGNEELANEANVTTFTVSRLLGEWQRKGFLVKSRGRILIRSLEDLVRSVG
jgi:CRP-like cAMP-binding protein